MEELRVISVIDYCNFARRTSGNTGLCRRGEAATVLTIDGLDLVIPEPGTTMPSVDLCFGGGTAVNVNLIREARCLRLSCSGCGHRRNGINREIRGM